MNLQNLKKLFADHGCQKIYIKKLSPNDNSKNQVYLASSWEVLNIFPLKEIRHVSPGEWQKERFKASINFYWFNDSGELSYAPKAQLILYPKYPEIRFSGFLYKCENAPSELMTQRLADRLLFLGISKKGDTLGYVTSPDSKIAQEFTRIKTHDEAGIFKVIELPQAVNNKEKLLTELSRIHQLDWIRSKSLTKAGLVSCEAPQCGGYTLEAELGIIRNGFAEPDYLGWEVKNFGVSNFNNLNSATITLFTPEPTGGLYKTKGVEYFIKTYGYADKKGIPDRLNFGGIYKVGQRHQKTNLELQLLGFDTAEGKIRNADGSIALIDNNGNIAASWSFTSMLAHWNRKHNQSCYVPSLSNKSQDRQYKYGNKVILGAGTDFQFFLQQMANGIIYYDPGIKIEGISTSKPKPKKRSQFRIKSKHINVLYHESEIITLP
jgi:hypothetical protein